MTMLPQKYTGFSLIEMLIVVSILTITAMIAIPAFLDQFKKLEAHNIANNIKTFLVGARHDAMIYQRTLTVCMVDEQQKCVTSQGKRLISFHDKNGNRKFDIDTDTLKNSTSLNTNYGDLQLRVALNRHYIDFKPETSTPIGFMGHVKYCPKDGNTNNMFKVSFNKNGFIKIKPHQEEATDC